MCVFSDDDRFLMSSGNDNEVRIYDVAQRTQHCRLQTRRTYKEVRFFFFFEKKHPPN